MRGVGRKDPGWNAQEKREKWMADVCAPLAHTFMFACSLRNVTLPQKHHLGDPVLAWIPALPRSWSYFIHISQAHPTWPQSPSLTDSICGLLAGPLSFSPPGNIVSPLRTATASLCLSLVKSAWLWFHLLILCKVPSTLVVATGILSHHLWDGEDHFN